ncbi:MAG: sigma-70 family RNA polymerase sigma factor [Clostridia bacterium]|nr:sigma-70 family RNA polymerase sigma factor [Clostridia bacterium]
MVQFINTDKCYDDSLFTSYADIISKYEKPLYALAFSHVLNREAAFEILQETFVLFYPMWIKSKNEKSFLPKLYRTCRHIYRKYPVSKKNSVKNTSYNALCSLPEKYRRVMFLKDMFLCDNHEISEMLGISEKVTKQLVFSGRNALIDILSNADL